MMEAKLIVLRRAGFIESSPAVKACYAPFVESLRKVGHDHHNQNTFVDHPSQASVRSVVNLGDTLFSDRLCVGKELGDLRIDSLYRYCASVNTSVAHERGIRRRTVCPRRSAPERVNVLVGILDLHGRLMAVLVQG